MRGGFTLSTVCLNYKTQFTSCHLYFLSNMIRSSFKASNPVVMSSGARGRSPSVKIFVHFGGAHGIAMMNFLTTIWLLRSL